MNNEISRDERREQRENTLVREDRKDMHPEQREDIRMSQRMDEEGPYGQGRPRRAYPPRWDPRDYPRDYQRDYPRAMRTMDRGYGAYAPGYRYPLPAYPQRPMAPMRYRMNVYDDPRRAGPERVPYERRPPPFGYSYPPRRRRIPIDPVPMNVLGIFGLDIEMNEDELRKWVEGKIGDIKFEKIQLIINRYTRLSRGFGFIYFKSIEDATKAKELMNAQVCGGYPVRVDYSITPEGRSRQREDQQEMAERDHDAY